MIVIDSCHHRYRNLYKIYLKESITINALIMNLILIILKLKKMKSYSRSALVAIFIIKRNLIKI